MQKYSKKIDGAATQPPEKIPTGEPIVPPYNGPKILLIARLLHEERTAGASVDLEEEGSQVMTLWMKL